MKFRLFYLFVFSILLSCGGAEVEPERFKSLSDGVKLLIKTDKGLFRGINFGASEVEVLENEGESPGGTEGDYIFYNLPITPDDKIEVYYYFNEEGKVNSFASDIFLKNDSVTTLFFNDLDKYYSNKFGDPEESAHHFRSWNLMGGQHLITLQAIEEQDDSGIQLEIK